MTSEERKVLLRFANFMFRYYDLEIVNKKDSILMRIIAWFLNVTKIMKWKTFME